MAESNAMIDLFMKGKVNWRESPEHLWRDEVKPQLMKLQALTTLIDNGLGEIISAGWQKDYSYNVAYGICGILGDVQVALMDFEEKLPQKLKSLLRENFEKAAREAAEAIAEKEPVSDPKIIASYKSAIKTLLDNMAPEKREQAVSELKEDKKTEIEPA